MRYALLVGFFCVCCCCSTFADDKSVLAKEEPTLATAESTPAVAEAEETSNTVCSGGACRIFPRRAVTRTRTVTAVDACGTCNTQEYSRTRYRGRVFPLFPRRVSRYSGCNCN